MTAAGPPPSGSPVTLVALLYLHPGREAEFERFESEASRIMGRHGGRIARRIKLSGSSAPGSARDPGSPRSPRPPDEVHIVEFIDGAAFSRYRADPEIRALADVRAAAIRDTIVWQGEDTAVVGAG
jgi:hypothetical protein